MSNQNKTNNKKVLEEKVETSIPKQKKHSKLRLGLKFLFILSVTIGGICFTDYRGYFEPQKTYHESMITKSYEKFTQTDTVDVLLLGNSIQGAGINCHLLTNALGANCFSLFTSASDVKDAYFTLKDALTKTTPKIVVLETFAVGDILSSSLPKTKKAFNFSLRSDTWEKVKSMPYLFSIEEYAGAWSSSIRNHEFIFRDTTQIRKNLNATSYKELICYLGDSNLDQKGISDSVEALYVKQGAPIDGNKVNLHDFDKEYIEKINQLCKENNIELVFLSIPQYYKHIKDYAVWKSKLASVIEPTGRHWLDLQAKNDSATYPRSYFENAYKVNQHMVYEGAIYVTLQFASFLKDSVKVDLPDRTTQQKWQDKFYDSEGYMIVRTPRENDTINRTICNNRKFGNITIQSAHWIKGQHNKLVVKFEKNTFTDEEVIKPKKLLIRGLLNGKKVQGAIDIAYIKNLYPFNNQQYSNSFIKDFVPTEIVDIIQD